MKKIRTILKRTVIALLIISFAATPAVSARGYEDLSADQLERMGIYFTKGDYTCGANSAGTTTAGAPGAGNGALDLTPQQVANAKIVIGVAKTYNLGRKGALIGLMVAIDESHLRMYASKGIAISRQNPAWTALTGSDRALGNDYDSVGVFQQRVSTGWSTFGNLVNDAQRNSTDTRARNITWQLMDPTYGAQAFYGTPPGAKLPSGLAQPTALQKGLQNVKDWQTRAPWIAAQDVQVSFDPLGRNYLSHMTEAQSVLDAYWDTAAPVPLPISVNGSATATGTTGGGAGCDNLSAVNGTAVEKMKAIIAKYSWSDYRHAGTSNATQMKAAYVSAVKTAKGKGEYIGDCGGVDCGGFVTRVMRDSGADPSYNKYEGNTAAQMQYLFDYSDVTSKHKEGAPIRYHHLKDSEKLQPGDIAVQSNGSTHHTFIYVGKMTGLDDQNKNPVPFNGAVASASQCDRAPMASGLDTRSKYEWFRIVDQAKQTN